MNVIQNTKQLIRDVSRKLCQLVQRGFIDEEGVLGAPSGQFDWRWALEERQQTLDVLDHWLIVVVRRCRDDEFEEGFMKSLGPLEEISGCALMLFLFETVVLIKDGKEGQIVDDTVF